MRVRSFTIILTSGLLLCLATGLIIGIGECTVRLIDGYHLFSLKLIRTLDFQRNLSSSHESHSEKGYTLGEFLKTYPFADSVDMAWIHLDPPLRENKEPPADFTKRFSDANGDPYVTYLWNDYLVEQILKDGKDLGSFSFMEAAYPDSIFVYPAPWKTMFPRYRYPQNVRLPSGIQTNQFGWRSGPIELKKPRKTIRIACVGASTTASAHAYAFSYPEFLEHWLNLWKEQKGYDLKFEVINAGREGINSNDIAAVVKYEVLPLNVDYVVYYEGSNQFNPPTMVKYPSDVSFGNPPAGLVPNFEKLPSTDKTWLDWGAEYSAIVDRVRMVVESSFLSGVEPSKPTQTFFLPEGVDEFSPDPQKSSVALNLGIILSDLNEIKMGVENAGGKIIMTTFKWLVFNGMVLDPVKHRGLYVYLNRMWWPMSYENMERMALFQNRVFKKWAQENMVDIVEVAEKIPQEPDLFNDAIHNSQLGIKIRGWIVFEGLISILERDLHEGTVPRNRVTQLKQHPFIKKGYTIYKSDYSKKPK